MGNLTPRQISVYSKAFFARYYLGFGVPEHQRRWYDYCDRHRHLMLSPRAHGKTTIFCHAFPVWAVCNIPNVRILMVSKTQQQAQKLIQTIRKELTENDKIKEDYGALIVDRKDTGNTIWCVRDEEGRKLKDATVECVGANGAITGGHFDIIICDDIVDDENTKTAARMATMENWFKGTIGQLCEPHTQWIVTGTRKHFADIYNDLIENALWQKKIDKAIIKYPESYEYVYAVNEDGQEYIADVVVEGDYEVLWEDEWDIKTLLKDRQQTGSLIFDREKQNDPSGMKGQFLNVDWLHYYEWSELPADSALTYYITADLAISEAEQADETVFTLSGYDSRKHKIYYVEQRAGRWDFPKQQEELKRCYVEWAEQGMRASKVLIENNVYQAALAQQIAVDTWIPAVGVRTTKDKFSKMMSIAPHFENGSVVLRKTELCGVPEFRMQWAQFPSGKHDDRLDSFALVILYLALENQSALGVADPDAGLNDVRPVEAYEYVFCGNCGEEYGTIPERYPDVNGKCSVCGEGIPVFPEKLMR